MMDIAELIRTLEKSTAEMQEATRKQSESNLQLRQEWGLPKWEQEFPVSELEIVLQELVWPAPQQESFEPEPEVQALEPELPAPERKPAVQELQLPEEEELPPSESEGEELPELQLYEEEELKCPAPPQPRPPPQQSSPALVGTVPCPVLVDTLPECMDLPVLDLVPSACTTMSGVHQCVTCQAKLPASDPHDDCVSRLGPDHAASALADRAYCQLCAEFQTRTLRQRARKAVGGRSPSSGSSHTISAPPSSAFTPPVAAQPPRSPSSPLSAGQRSPARRTRERSRSPSSHGARPCRESRSRSRSPRRRRYSLSPRRGRRRQETSGVAELTSKMSQFMEVMMGQQSLLMTLANVVPRAPELPTGPVTGQPVVPPPVPHGQPQEVWDVDAVSRDASDAEPVEGTEPEGTSQHSEQDDPEVLDTNDPM
ncbi:UNVERIFIED_CONTAM: hypothetical protein FKN15_076696 [Acipenser sinensis]